MVHTKARLQGNTYAVPLRNWRFAAQVISLLRPDRCACNT